MVHPSRLLRGDFGVQRARYLSDINKPSCLLGFEYDSEMAGDRHPREGQVLLHLLPSVCDTAE